MGVMTNHRLESEHRAWMDCAHFGRGPCVIRQSTGLENTDRPSAQLLDGLRQFLSGTACAMRVYKLGGCQSAKGAQLLDGPAPISSGVAHVP